MLFRFRASVSLVVAGLGFSGALPAAELGVGTTREEVVAQLGAPKSKMSAGDREIFSYPQGRVIMADGKVVSLELKPAAATPLPLAPSATASSEMTAPVKTPPAPPANAVVKIPPPPAVAKEIWFTD